MLLGYVRYDSSHILAAEKLKNIMFFEYAIQFDGFQPLEG